MSLALGMLLIFCCITHLYILYTIQHYTVFYFLVETRYALSLQMMHHWLLTYVPLSVSSIHKIRIMVPAIRKDFNKNFTKEKYEAFLNDLNSVLLRWNLPISASLLILILSDVEVSSNRINLRI